MKHMIFISRGEDYGRRYVGKNGPVDNEHEARIYESYLGAALNKGNIARSKPYTAAYPDARIKDMLFVERIDQTPEDSWDTPFDEGER